MAQFRGSTIMWEIKGLICCVWSNVQPCITGATDNLSLGGSKNWVVVCNIYMFTVLTIPVLLVMILFNSFRLFQLSLSILYLRIPALAYPFFFLYSRNRLVFSDSPFFSFLPSLFLLVIHRVMYLLYVL